MFELPRHGEIAVIVWATAANGRWLQTVNWIVELSIVKPKALINDTVGILDEYLVWITRIAHICAEQLEHLHTHSSPMADIHVSKLYGLVPHGTKHATRLVKETTINSNPRETCRKKRENDKRLYKEFGHEAHLLNGPRQSATWSSSNRQPCYLQNPFHRSHAR
jgi:hypothetical protein